jgi:hypothetical protein
MAETDVLAETVSDTACQAPGVPTSGRSFHGDGSRLWKEYSNDKR